MITKIEDWKIFEKKQKNGGIDVVVVDVQEPFKEFFGDLYVEELQEYCEDFKRVFQIWDTTKASKPDYVFKNQVKTYSKKYGGELRIEDVEQYFTRPMWETVKYKIENIPDSGDIFETKYGDSWVYIGGSHLWFKCSKELMLLFKSFKNQERKIILVGGADKECLLDIYVTMLSLGIDVEYNTQFIYSAKGSIYQ